jgi:outer membrane protein OmpA-like peptidoglycan-associated protein
MKHQSVLSRVTRALCLVLLAFAVGCGGAPPQDAMDAARAAVDGASGAERCAEAEFRAARSLLDQANAAYEGRDYDRARQLAEAARQQAARAEQIAEENREDCERAANAEDELNARDDQANNGANDNTDNSALVDPNYEWDAVYFDFNISSLTVEGRQTLDAHAQQLNAASGVRIVIEGHCDQRGTMKYNFALGERRARAVRDYLSRLGVDPARMSTVSYGAEDPSSSNDRQNRRAEFRVR